MQSLTKEKAKTYNSVWTGTASEKSDKNQPKVIAGSCTPNSSKWAATSGKCSVTKLDKTRWSACDTSNWDV